MVSVHAGDTGCALDRSAVVRARMDIDRQSTLEYVYLIGLGTGAAYLYSVVATLTPGWFPDSFRGHGGELAVYFEPAVAIIALVLLGQVFSCKPGAEPAAH